MKAFQDYAYYYNAFYQDKNYCKEAQEIDILLKKYSESKVESIINFGCGTGRHDIELCKMGYHCEGIDMSPLMIEIARKNALIEKANHNFSVCDIREYEAERKYDAVISLFHVLSYQNTNEDVLRTFKAARNALNVGSIFIFDAWYGPGVLSDKPAVRVKKYEDEKNEMIRVATPVMHDKESVVDVNYDIFIMNKDTKYTEKITEIHKMRYFFRPEIECYLELSGFKLIENIDCQTLGETSYDSWTSYFIAQAI